MQILNEIKGFISPGASILSEHHVYFKDPVFYLFHLNHSTVQNKRLSQKLAFRMQVLLRILGESMKHSLLG